MKHFLFVLGTERYTEEQIWKAKTIAVKGEYTEVFVPTPDGSSQLNGKIPFWPAVTSFKCCTMIVPVNILAKIKDHYHTINSDIRLTFCDLIDTWRCEINRVAAGDAGYQSEVLKQGNLVRRITPVYEYPVK